ncbi:uncharacterized protein [Drosophila bipectinata]|uniref:uncharacterized protein n=1 Tax=Drosophila bipectinata TaxID=42026 RepID=UPI0007E77A59|nr:uncharacterized protein LOC108129626 [Drosophila bipectinata]
MSELASSEEETDFSVVSSRNYQRVQDKVAKISYVDGIADGREKVFQASFDRGYEDGFKTGFELAKLSAYFETENLPKPDETQKFKQLDLPEATDKTHFQYLIHQGVPLNEVSEKQAKYLDNLMDQFAQTIPETINLFTPQKRETDNVNVV